MLRAGDMIVRDAEGIIASVAYGPDDRTRLRADTDAALFGAWCPVGIAPMIVEAHFEKLSALIEQEWPASTVETVRLVR